MKKYKEDINALKKDFNNQELERLQIQRLLNLIDKLEDQHIEVQLVNLELEELISKLGLVKSNAKGAKKSYNKSFYNIKQKIQKEFGIVEKGTYNKMGIGLGMTFGICIGAAFASSMSNGIVIGMVLGMAVGAAFGNLKEKQTAKVGKTY
jgi:hypothetical protein